MPAYVFLTKLWGTKYLMVCTPLELRGLKINDKGKNMNELKYSVVQVE